MAAQALTRCTIAARNFACKAWFTVCVLVCFAWCYPLCMLARYVVPGSTADREGRACIACHLCFKYLMLLSCPWIKVDSPSLSDWQRLLGREKVFLAMNHSSYMDSILFVAACPTSVVWRYRTLMKAGLFDVPLLGAISRAIGHFPVHFISKDENEFRVEKVC
jgi:1-acyl-sn-glycerol-3-phosphate acyltransferase